MRTTFRHHTRVATLAAGHATDAFWKEHVLFGAILLGTLSVLAVQTIYLS